jgi:hypothetical protein
LRQSSIKTMYPNISPHDYINGITTPASHQCAPPLQIEPTI